LKQSRDDLLLRDSELLALNQLNEKLERDKKQALEQLDACKMSSQDASNHDDKLEKYQADLEKILIENGQLLSRNNEMQNKLVLSDQLISQLEKEKKSQTGLLEMATKQLQEKTEQLGILESIRVDLQEKFDSLNLQTHQSNTLLTSVENTIQRQTKQFSQEIEEGNRKITTLRDQLEQQKNRIFYSEPIIIQKIYLTDKGNAGYFQPRKRYT